MPPARMDGGIDASRMVGRWPPSQTRKPHDHPAR